MFQTLRWRLLVSYLGVMAGILTLSSVLVYQVFARSLYQELDRQLFTLADAAAHSLEELKSDRAHLLNKTPRSLDHDGDLDIPWQDLKASHQSVEWFDRDRRFLGRAGENFPNVPLTEDFHVLQNNHIRSLTVLVPITNRDHDDQQTIQGYVRVSESTKKIERELDKLLWGFEWGGLVMLALSGLSGWWLTRQSLKPVEQSFQKLKQFTADASHELRSPLTVIRTSVEVIQSHPERVHPADEKKLAAIADASQQMTQLVEDLLLLARTDRAPRESAPTWIELDIHEILEDLIDLLEPQAEVKEIALKADLTDCVYVCGDAVHLQRLFANLLENALQYTPAGGSVQITSKIRDRDVIISIVDTGIGIAPEHIPQIFDRFWRADTARSYRIGGAGLGLAIAQSIAHTHGGEITASSQIGVGSCFQVRLPLKN